MDITCASTRAKLIADMYDEIPKVGRIRRQTHQALVQRYLLLSRRCDERCKLRVGQRDLWISRRSADGSHSSIERCIRERFSLERGLYAFSQQYILQELQLLTWRLVNSSITVSDGVGIRTDCLFVKAATIDRLVMKISPQET